MCMGGPGCGGGGSRPAAKANSYTPKKMGGGNKGSYTPKSRPQVMSSFGKPQIKVSFSGRGR